MRQPPAHVLYIQDEIDADEANFTGTRTWLLGDPTYIRMSPRNYNWYWKSGKPMWNNEPPIAAVAVNYITTGLMIQAGGELIYRAWIPNPHWPGGR